MNDWYCRYCSHYTTSSRCTCDDVPEVKPEKKVKSRRVKMTDKTYRMRGDMSTCYVGHEVTTNLIYAGAPYFDDHVQIHLNIREAKWLSETLQKAIARAEKIK